MDGIEYLKTGTWYEMHEWAEEEQTVSERLIPVDNSIYDHIVYQSDTERKFIEKLKKRKDVKLFVKLPGWFKAPQPLLGNTTRIGALSWNSVTPLATLKGCRCFILSVKPKARRFPMSYAVRRTRKSTTESGTSSEHWRWISRSSPAPMTSPNFARFITA